MNILKLKEVEEPFLSIEDISQALGITLESARNTACRYVGSGILVRAARDVYILRDAFRNLTIDDKLKLANRIQPSSYISFMSALSYFEASTQMQQDYFESCALMRSKELNVGDLKYRYFRIRKELYFAFDKINGMFIARPEKAILDSIYLMSMGRYSLDVSSLSYNAINKKKLGEYIKNYPEKTKNLWEKIRERINRA